MPQPPLIDYTTDIPMGADNAIGRALSAARLSAGLLDQWGMRSISAEAVRALVRIVEAEYQRMEGTEYAMASVAAYLASRLLSYAPDGALSAHQRTACWSLLTEQAESLQPERYIPSQRGLAWMAQCAVDGVVRGGALHILQSKRLGDLGSDIILTVLDTPDAYADPRWASLVVDWCIGRHHYAERALAHLPVPQAETVLANMALTARLAQWRDPEPIARALTALSGRPLPLPRSALVPFLESSAPEIRLAAIMTTQTQDAPETVPAAPVRRH